MLLIDLGRTTERPSNNGTKACDTSIRLHRLPLTFTLSLQLKMLIKANYNQQMYGTSHGTVFYAIITNNENKTNI